LELIAGTELESPLHLVSVQAISDDLGIQEFNNTMVQSNCHVCVDKDTQQFEMLLKGQSQQHLK
jgi:hypothetical protein